MPNVPWNKTTILSGLLACSLILNVVLLAGRPDSEQPEVAPTAADSEQQASSNDTAAAEETGDPDATGSDDGLAAEGPVQPDEIVTTAGWLHLRGNVQHSLARTFQQQAGEDGDALTSVFTRLFVWDIDMRRDLQKGDALAVVWRKNPDGLPEIAAASLNSSKLGRNVEAYRWQAPGDPFPSYWHLDGTEVPLRLEGGPITGYEQITSLLKDRPSHKGMDFKTPVGTEVRAPRAGTVTRTNWNWKANGNGIEIKYDDGVLAKFLHLNENRVKKGDRVKVGQVIALTGNTGHSTAPHLHYQLDRGNKTLDPLDYHGTLRRSLDEAAAARLRSDVAGFAKLLSRSDGE